MNLRQVTLLDSGKRGTRRAWGIRRIFLSLMVCMLAMVAGQSMAQEITEDNLEQWIEASSQGNLEATYKVVCYYTALEVVNFYLIHEIGIYYGLYEFDDWDELIEIDINVYTYLFTQCMKAIVYWRSAADEDSRGTLRSISICRY